MAGIISYGAYIPFNRLDRRVLREMYGNPVPKGEKAVANYDEDSLTMAVAAALDCTSGLDADSFDRLYFATTTPPHREKQSAATIAGTLDMKSSAFTLDLTGSLRSGSGALIAGLDAAERGEQVVVAVSDSRLGAAAGQFEALLGDGAAAFLLGSQKVIAEIIDHQSVTADFYDNWRSSDDRFVRSWEERFCQTQGYQRFTLEAAGTLLKRLQLKPSDFSRAVIYGLKAGDALALGRRMGFTPEQVQDSLIDKIGNTGAAGVPMALVAALEESSPGDRILMVTYGDGSDAIAFQVTEEILNLRPRRGIKGHIDSKKTDMNYGKYLRWRELIEVEPQRRPPLARASLPDRRRNLKKILGFYGNRCLVCGTPQFPAQRVCIHCQTLDRMEDYKFLGKTARLATFTLDYLAPSLDPPTVMAVVDYEGGGRFVCLMTDCLADQLTVGMEVEMSFRKLFEAEGIGAYFWKAISPR